MKKNLFHSRKFWLLLLCGLVLAGISSQLPLSDWFTQLQNWLRLLGVWAIPAFIGLYLIATVIGLPNILLILVAGSLFGLWKGIGVVSIADTLGAVICFGLGRTIARNRIKKWISRHPSFAQLDQAIGRKGWKILLLTRLSPLVPSNVLNYGFSCTKVNFWQYCFFSWLGMLPIIALYVYLGSWGLQVMQTGLTPGKMALQAAGLGLAIGAIVYTTRMTRKALAPPCPPEPQKCSSKSA